jgi:hypothetical protein
MFAWNINNIVLSIFMVAEKRGKKEKKLFVFWNHFNFICQVISFNWWKESLNSEHGNLGGNNCKKQKGCIIQIIA